MNKIYMTISAFLLAGNLMFAQTQRTTKTTIADILAQMPAKQTADYNKLINDLVQTGEEGILILAQMLDHSQEDRSIAVDYALSGLSHYVMTATHENARGETARAYGKALDQVQTDEAKAFLIRQIQLIGKDESVDVLKKYLTDDRLSGPASRALAAIKTDLSGQALLDALVNSSGLCCKNIIQAIALHPTEGAEAKLLPWIVSPDPALQKEIFCALGKTGSIASMPTLAASTKAARYTMETTGATDAYIALIERIHGQGHLREAEKATAALLKDARKAGAGQTRIAALQLWMKIKKQEGLKLALAALEDTDTAYRTAALSFAAAYANPEFYRSVVRKMIKSKPQVKTDILNWLAVQVQIPQVNKILHEMEAKIEVSGVDIVVQQMKDPDFGVVQAAAWVLVRLKDPQTLPSIVALLSSGDKQKIALAKEALASYDGEASLYIARALPSMPDDGKITALQLLALRKSSEHVNRVYEQIASENELVKTTALQALKDVVTIKELTRLSGMLQQATPAEVAMIQEAIMEALSFVPKEQQVQLLEEQIYRVDLDMKPRFYRILANAGGEKSLKLITDAFTKGVGKAKEAAFEALLQFKGPEVSGTLFAICADPSASVYFDKALHAYVENVATSQMTGENQLIFLRKAMEIAVSDDQKINILRHIEKANTFLSLMYAGQFLENKPLQQTAANAVMNIALNNKNYTGLEIERLLNRVMEVLDNPDAAYQKEAIRKHLSEISGRPGFVSLFNGKNLTGWQGLVGNPLTRAAMQSQALAAARKKADQRAKDCWSAEKGVLVFNGKGDNLCTDRLYGDFEMYIDWQLDPSDPDGDAGIYLRGTPQVQIWNTSRKGAEAGSGGLYNNQSNPSAPLRYADNQLGEWNTFYIKMAGERVTVCLNGHVVVDNIILENYWDRQAPLFAEEQIELQAHGSKVAFRNIYIRELPRIKPYELSAEEKKEGFRVLFDGTSMNEWTGNTVDYVVEDGCIVMHPSRSFGGNLYTKKEYKDFVYRFEFMLTPGANNGLGIRTPMEGDAAYVGMELQILDNDAPIYRDLNIYQYHGSVYGILPAKRGFLKPVGEWNYQEVIAKGNHIQVILNGEVILDGDIKEATRNGTADKLQHPGLFNEKGHIGFLGHGSEVRFRHIRIKELK